MVSLDAPEENRRFAESVGSDQVLLSDPDGTAARAYGVLAPEGDYALRWTVDNGSVATEQLSSPAGFEPGNIAWDINDLGQVVGYGTNSSNKGRLLVWTTDEAGPAIIDADAAGCGMIDNSAGSVGLIRILGCPPQLSGRGKKKQEQAHMNLHEIRPVG